MTGSRTIAVFDYDDTLVYGDSLWPFLTAVAGTRRALCVLIKALVCLPFQKGESRTYVKARLLQELLGGKRLSDLAKAIEKIREWPVEKEFAVSALKEHRAKGHHIVIASGGLDVYLPALLAGIPHDDIICTRMEVIDGVVTGRMASGNCVRTLKADRVRNYLETHGPFDDSWGYGNAPHDIPMLRHVKHGTLVR